jgi:hypothetical protein
MREMLQGAQIIGLGMATLGVFARGKKPEMWASLRIRYRGCANGPHRSALNTGKAPN